MKKLEEEEEEEKMPYISCMRVRCRRPIIARKAAISVVLHATAATLERNSNMHRPSLCMISRLVDIYPKSFFAAPWTIF